MKLNPLASIAVVGSILMMAGVFLTWASGTVDYLIGTKELTYTGWDFIGNENLAKVADFNKVPGFTLLLGAVCLFASIPPLITRRMAVKVLPCSTAVVSAILMGFQMRFYEDVAEGLDFFGHELISTEIGIGLWVSFMGCIVVFVGSAIDVMMREESGHDV